MKEECGIEMEEKELIDLTEFAYKEKEKGVFLSPGLLDEFMRIFAYKKTISQEEMKKLQGKLTGNIDEGEMIKLKIVKLNQLWKYCPDAKSLSSLFLYSLYSSLPPSPPSSSSFSTSPPPSS